MPEDEERASIGAAEQQLNRPLWHVDTPDALAITVVDEDPAVGDVDVAVAVRGRALPTALREHLQTAERAIGLDGRAIGAVFSAARDVHLPARRGGEKSVRVEIVRPPPTGRIHP